MTDEHHDRWSDDLAAYVLGALDPAEVAELERHAEGCERCAAEIRWLTPAVQALPESVERVQPPPELRDRVMAEVRADAAEREHARDGSRDDPSTGRLMGWLRGLGEGRHGLWPAAGLAATVLVATAIAGFAIGGGGADGGGTSTIVAGRAPGVTAKLVSEGDGGTLRLANVNPLPPGRVLEAWVRRNGEVEPVQALFVPDREGRASTTIDDMHGVDTVMVTTEPPSGSESPTSAPLVTISMPVQ
jgi:anti-sigma-K factor RskA